MVGQTAAKNISRTLPANFEYSPFTSHSFLKYTRNSETYVWTWWATATPV